MINGSIKNIMIAVAVLGGMYTNELSKNFGACDINAELNTGSINQVRQNLRGRSKMGVMILFKVLKLNVIQETLIYVVTLLS